MAPNHLDQTFQALRARKKRALVAYMAAGYPALEEQTLLVESLQAGGADVLELGIPFSDPIADGPTIQFASQQALENGARLGSILEWTARLRKKVTLPFVYMSYTNPIVKYGAERFAADASAAGVSGLIVPDLIIEEADELERALAAAGIHLIHLVAPTTPRARQKEIARRTRGFLYAVSVTGVTGARKELPAETASWLSGLRKAGPAPVCVGFGISGPEHVRQLRDAADGFIVGSALVDLIRKTPAAERPAKVQEFATSLSQECSYGG